MNGGICHIVGAGEDEGLSFTRQADDFVIAADAGYAYLQRAGISPDLVVGDFDSLPSRPDHPRVIALSKEKDETDTFVALSEGIRMGYRRFHLHCCSGGRPDHAYGNLQLLTYLSTRGLRGLLFDRQSVCTAITDAALTLERGEDGYVSVFAYSERAEGVSLTGLKYPLSDATLTNDFPLGVSNAFQEKNCVISVKHGTLLVMYPRSAREISGAIK